MVGTWDRHFYSIFMEFFKTLTMFCCFFFVSHRLALLIKIRLYALYEMRTFFSMFPHFLRFLSCLGNMPSVGSCCVKGNKYTAMIVVFLIKHEVISWNSCIFFPVRIAVSVNLII